MRMQRARNWMLVVAAASVIYGFGNLYQPTVVVGESMAPTLRDGRVIWVDRTYYRTHKPRCGEVVVFKDGGETYVKRVYRGPGETVHYIACDGQFLVPVREPFFPELKARYEKGRTVLRVTQLRVPDDSVFVLGDNFSDSVDSRQLGTIPITSIIGRAHLDVSPAQALKYEFVPMPGRRSAQSDEGQQQAPAAPRQPEDAQPDLRVHELRAGAEHPELTPYRVSQR